VDGQTPAVLEVEELRVGRGQALRIVQLRTRLAASRPCDPIG
jgi:hypothetical protein